jgi:hypothetical protein
MAAQRRIGLDVTKRTPSKGAKASEKSENSSVRKRLGLLKGIIFIVVAGLALAAGIYNGGEGMFFGAVFAMGFGLLGVLSFIRNDKTTKSRGR